MKRSTWLCGLVTVSTVATSACGASSDESELALFGDEARAGAQLDDTPGNPGDDEGKPDDESDAGSEAPVEQLPKMTIVDPEDPPVPPAACGDDLEAHNGTLIPYYGDTSAPSTFSGDPIEKGPYQMVAQDVTLPNPDPERSEVNATAYAPSLDGAAPLAGPLAFVVVVPGFSYKHGDYVHMTEHLVSHGFAVLGVSPADVGFTDKPNNPANVAEIEAAVDWALETSQLAGKVDEDKMAIAGHSQGGKLSFFTATQDDRFKLVIGWDPQNGGGAPCKVSLGPIGIPISQLAGQDCNAWPVAPNCVTEDPGMLADLRAETLVFAARDKGTTPDEHNWAENFYRGAPSPASLVLSPASKHADWLDDGKAITQVTKRVQLATLLARFRGTKGLDAYLPNGTYLNGVTEVAQHTTK